MGKHEPGLTTHALDTVSGKPAAGMAVELWHIPPRGEPVPVAATMLNADGRTEAPLLSAETFLPGTYELRFFVGDHFRRHGLGGDPPFLDVVPLRVTLVAEAGHYHVPLLVSPWSYSTYRGS
jgi:5-hydroxyisourate hydrolase